MSVPFGAPYGEFGTAATEYRTASDPTGTIDCFGLTTGSGMIQAQLRNPACP